MRVFSFVFFFFSADILSCVLLPTSNFFSQFDDNKTETKPVFYLFNVSSILYTKETKKVTYAGYRPFVYFFLYSL